MVSSVRVKWCKSLFDSKKFSYNFPSSWSLRASAWNKKLLFDVYLKHAFCKSIHHSMHFTCCTSSFVNLLSTVFMNYLVNFTRRGDCTIIDDQCISYCNWPWSCSDLISRPLKSKTKFLRDTNHENIAAPTHVLN